MNTKPKVLVVGLDAMEADLVAEWASSGDLPTLAKMRRDGLWGRPEALPGLGNDANWTSFLTGVRAGRHGRYFYRQLENGSYTAMRPDEKAWGREPFWTYLGRSGKRCISIDMPYGVVTEDFNGIQVTDWLVHDRIYPEPQSWPKEVAERLVGISGRREAHVHDLHGRTPADYKDLVHQLKERIEIKTKVAMDYAKREDWDLFLLSFTDAHDAGHICWHLHDPSHPRHDAALVAEIGDPMKTIYMAIDAALGRLIEVMDESVTVLVFSCIGMGPNYSGNYLLDHFLRLREFGPETPKRSVDGIRRVYRSLMPSALRNLLLPFAANTDERLLANDRSRRSYFYVPHNEISGAVRINLKGREANGKIEPGEEYDRLCDELAKDLAELVDADTGRPVVKEVVRTRTAYSGPFIDSFPDLFVIWNKEKHLTAMGLERIGFVRADYPGNRSGDHSPHIFFGMQGPGLASKQLNSTVDVTDFAPTVAAILGVDPADWDGTAITAQLEPS